MSNTYRLHTILHSMAAILIAAGIVTTAFSGVKLVTAAVTRQGAVTLSSGESMAMTHIPAEENDSELRLVMGMLLVLAGFGFHALGVVRSERANLPHMRKRPKHRKLPRRWKFA